MRQTDRATALRSAENIISTISADLARNIELFDLSVQAAIDNLKNPDLDRVSDETRQLILFDRSATAKHLGRIHVANEQGRVIFDSRTATADPLDVSDRDYFQAHKSNLDLGLYIGQPFITSQHYTVISISRRLAKPDGSFGGVAAGMLRLDYVQELFNRVNLDAGSALTLALSDGTMLARSPYIAGVIGKNFGGSAIHQQALLGKAGNFDALAGIDGLKRLYAFQRVEALPLLLMIGLSTDQVFSHWRGEALYFGAIILMLALATVSLAVFAARELRRRAEAERRLTTLATTDSLTGLFNRRSFDATIEKEWKRAKREGTPLALLMIDADHFKAYNDQHGHQAGDKALASIAACVIASSCEDTDLAARYGGEEFAVLLPNTTTDLAVRVGERIRASVAYQGTSDHLTLPTVSIGVASHCPGDMEESDSLVAAADRALYEAKRQGRNRVEPQPTAEKRLTLVA